MQNGWYHEVKETAKKYEIEIENAEGSKKSEWKRKVKKTIKEKMERTGQEKASSMKKLRRQVGQTQGVQRVIAEYGVA